MGRKSIIPDYQKIDAVILYLNGTESMSALCSRLQVNESSFRKWVMRYKSEGEAGLSHSSRNTHYTGEAKMNIVREYLEGLGSLHDLCIKYCISSDTVLSNWIKKYNGHEPMKSHNSGGGKIMTVGRKTTYEERVQIVSFCIANNENYQLASEKYQVSYQQAYGWTKKYKECGAEALEDRRGKRKDTDDMTETEKLAAQVKLLQAENKRLELENGFLKKLKEVERRREVQINILPLKNSMKKPDSQ